MVAFPRPGEQFGRYLIERVIGEGGMGIVYQATDAQLRRSVALKIVQPGLAQGDEFRTRFEREASTLARMRSRHIVQILEYGDVEGTVYLVTDFVPDGDLHHWLRRRGPLEPLAALKLMLPVCEALDDAHQAGVVHRDVKPSNVLLWERRPGELIPYLCDFGIATDGDSTTTRTGTLIGSLAYMAPERHLGEPASPAGDVYSAGCVLWACLTGKPPYDGTDFQLMTAHLNNPIPQLPGAVPGATEINPLLRRALAKDPAERYPSAAAFASAIDAAIDTLEDGPRKPRYASMPPPQLPATDATILPSNFVSGSRPQAASQPAPFQSVPPQGSAPGQPPASSSAAPTTPPPAPAPTAPQPARPTSQQPPQPASPPGHTSGPHPFMAPPGRPPTGPQAGPAGYAPGAKRRSRGKLLLIGGLVVLLLAGGGAGAWALLRGDGSGGPLKGDDKTVAALIASQVSAPTWADHKAVACATDKLLHDRSAKELAADKVVTKNTGSSSSDQWTYNSRWPYADAKAYALDVLGCTDDWAGTLAKAWHLESSSCLHDQGESSMAGVVAATSLTLSDSAASEVAATKSKLDGCYATNPAPPRLSAKTAYRSVKFTLTRPQAASGTTTVQVKDGGSWKPIDGTTYSVTTDLGGTKGCLQAQTVVSLAWGTSKTATSRACGTSKPPRIWLAKTPCTTSDCTHAWALHVEGFKAGDLLSVTNSFSGGNVTCGSDCGGIVLTDEDGRGVGDKWRVNFSPYGTMTATLGKYSASISLN